MSMNTCLFTGEALNANTKIEHTVLETLGGRLRSRVVTSSSFNQKSSDTLDIVAKQIYWPVMAELAPALPRNVRAGGIDIKTPGHIGNYCVNKMGQLEITSVAVVCDENGKPKYAIGPDEASVRRVSEARGLPIKKMEVVDPVRSDIFFGPVPSVNPKVEVCFLKCILLTFDHLLRNDPSRFTRSPELHECRELVRRFVEDRLESGDNTALIDISMGLQYEAKYRGLYESIVCKAGLQSTPFSHILIASGNSATKTLDAVFVAFGEDPHAFRLSSRWNGPAKTYVVTNGIFTGETASDLVLLDESWTLGTPGLRRSFIKFSSEDREPDMEAVADEIASHRFDIITKAIIYRQMKCDGSVAEQIGRSAVASWNSANSISLAIFDRLLVLFDADSLPPDRGELLINTVGPILDRAPFDSIKSEEEEPSRGWPFWTQLHRECFSVLIQTLGAPGRVYISHRQVQREGPSGLD